LINGFIGLWAQVSLVVLQKKQKKKGCFDLLNIFLLIVKIK
jgi:hypothetical protein